MLETIGPVRKILELEDAGSDLFSERLAGSDYALWPQVRFQFAAALTAKAFGSVSVPQAHDTGAFRRKLLRSLAPNRWDGARFDAARDLLYVTSGVTTYSERARERNWLVEGFVDEFPDDSVLMQWREVPSPNGPPAFADTRTLEPMLLRSSLSARFRRERRELFASATALVTRLAGLFGDEIDESTIAEIADREANRELARPLVEREFSRLLRRTRAKVLILEDASYGSHASLVALAKERGVLVVEPQHGWIGSSHPAYNFGAAMSDPALARLLPDVLLTFGEFWGGELRFPGRIVPVGKAHLDSLSAGTEPVTDRAREVLVVSSVGHPEATDDFVVRLRRLLPSEWRVSFRPHPSERGAIASRYPKLDAEDGVLVDEEEDVYRSLARVRVVVGVESTVLFEALKFGCTVVVRESATTPYYVGDVLGDPVPDDVGPELVVRRLEEGAGRSGVPLDAIWRPDARSNFADWVQSVRSARGSSAGG